MGRRGTHVLNARVCRVESMNYHVADRGGRAYLCRCSPAIRVGDRILHCFGRRHKRSKIQFDRWLARGG